MQTKICNRKEYVALTEIEAQIKDIEALRSACQEMGLILLQNVQARGYYECPQGTLAVSERQ